MGTTDSQVSRGLRTWALGKQFNIAVVANCYGQVYSNLTMAKTCVSEINES